MVGYGAPGMEEKLRTIDNDVLSRIFIASYVTSPGPEENYFYVLSRFT